MNDISKPNQSDEMSRLLKIMAKLRDPNGGCPWDLEQNFATIAPYTIEEAYEVADAIEKQDWDHLQEELGDLLLQVVFHAQMAKDENLFQFEDVARSVSEKMVRRHPHVFGSETIDTAEAQTVAWEAQKEAERRKKAQESGQVTPPSALDGVAKGLPAMMRALKLQNRAVRVGFDWPEISQVLDQIEEELEEVKEELFAPDLDKAKLKDEIGDLLFTVVNLARWVDVDPEAALRGCNEKFERRFRFMENDVQEAGKALNEVSLEVMEAGWKRAKKAEL